MLERTDAITNEVLEPITFVLAYPHTTLFLHLHIQIGAAVTLLTVRLLTREQQQAEDTYEYSLDISDCEQNGKLSVCASRRHILGMEEWLH
jgi:hypothetical protein